MVFEGCNHCEAGDAGCVQQVFRAEAGVLLHDLPFLLVELPRFAEDLRRNEHFSDIMEHGGDPDVVEKLPLDAEQFCLGQVQHADIG